jgi:hypothetical protein
LEAPQYGQPPSGVAITTRYCFLTLLFALFQPRVYLNGHLMPSWGWGRAVLPVAPGEYHVHVYTPYGLPSRVGPADYTTIVNPGQVVELEYRAPLFVFIRGSLGPPPQRYNGLRVTIAILSVSIAVAIAFVAYSLATS